MAYLVIVLAVLTRFFPHPWNFSPVYGALLFGGASMKKRDSVWFPALSLGVSDVVLAKYMYQVNLHWEELIFIAAFVSISLLGWILRRRVTAARLAVTCLASSISFFLITNLGVWLGFKTYPHTWDGLIACYVAAIPFQGRVMSSTAIFAAILFGVQHIYVRTSYSQKQPFHAVR